MYYLSEIYMEVIKIFVILDHSVTINCLIILKEHKIPILCKMNIKSDDTITVFNGIHATYNITNIVAYYIIPRYIQEN